MSEITPSCVVCDAVLCETDQPPGLGVVPGPHGATLFTSTGNYGSTAWDPQAGDRLRLLVWVCDPCLLARASQGVVLHLEEVPVAPERELTRWEGHPLGP